MSLPHFVAGTVAAGLMVLGAGLASGQNYPNKPIRIVTGSVGGGNDLMARLIGQAIAGTMGQPVIAENRPIGIAQIEIASRASPDGYTLLAIGPTLWIAPLFGKVPYDPVRDLSPITMTEKSPNILVVNLSVPANSVKELIAVAKARPGELNFATTAVGGSSHIAGELFKSLAGINIVRVDYKGSVLAVTDLVNGQVQLAFGSPVVMGPFAKAGKLRALAVTGAQPSALFPGLPTVAASGLPGYEADSISGMFAPAKTPEAIINQLNREIVRVLNRPDVKEKFLSSGMEATGSSPAQLAAAIKSEIERIGKVLRDAGIYPQ